MHDVRDFAILAKYTTRRSPHHIDVSLASRTMGPRRTIPARAHRFGKHKAPDEPAQGSAIGVLY